MSIANLKTRHIACVAVALALCGANPGARASDKTEAAELVAQSRDTLRSLVNDRDFVSMKSALAQAKGVLIFPQVVHNAAQLEFQEHQGLAQFIVHFFGYPAPFILLHLQKPGSHDSQLALRIP